jgi:uncharacterized membrane protein
VIIGAMLISPLMGPIINLGMGLATFDLRSIARSLQGTLAVGRRGGAGDRRAIVLVVAAAGSDQRNPGRTEPTFFDLLVAVLSGLAGAYATITRKGETIVGVAIATA